jgi:proteic killer suppression protein
MIKSFKDKETEKLYYEEYPNKIPNIIQVRALTKLRLINAAKILSDLKVPPSNYLEPLKGNRYESYSIRINDQFRICFVWIDNDAYNVEIVDYHK